ncbi:hypothetical protein HF325_002156 [Metschnikowia pulcherrima]|uniref:C2H2-type domain-containing protein n=1 Tax=Metschnikowia pulcherrima TaxID=27326 RepID=A0A8H7GUI4_9ASCO|nr:hypothetical protein HF325_002156 [Metschnikowia pulcherrima]
MTSLAVYPLQRSMTELTDDDLYLAPGSGTAFGLQSGPAYSNVSFSNGGVASAELSQILNVPDNFFENYSRRNGSQQTLSSASINTQDSLDTYGQTGETQRSSPFSAYAADSFDPYSSQFAQNQQNMQNQNQNQTQNQNQNQNGLQNAYQYQQYYQPPQAPTQQAFVQPQLLQMRSNMRNPARIGRITTLDDHDTQKLKDDDYYLFNTDIQPLQMMATKNYFNTEDAANNSLYIMNSDLDSAAPVNFSNLGPHADYMAMDEFVEDAEALSEDSDDDNCFQDEDFEDYGMGYGLPQILPDSDNSTSYMKVIPELESAPADDDMEVSANDLKSDMQEPVRSISYDSQSSHSQLDGSHLGPHNSHYSHHKTAAEILATNPEHQCELVNPLNGKPCNRKFSRPYDLIRHQETIHASEKKIYRCVICEGRANGGPGNGKLKTFSRNDALSRHIKVKHGLAGQEALDLINAAKENVEYVMI